jgi:flagellar biosynthesis/type III secretory pathway M-ring protein FliF/YscJ
VIAAIAPFVRAALVRAEEQQFDPNLVTPGVWGFVLTFVVMVIAVVLILDMVRRVRRVNYRAEVRAQLEAEARDAELGDADGQITDAAGDEPDDEEPPSAR